MPRLPVEGEALSFSHGYTAMAILSLTAAVLLGGMEVAWLVLGPHSREGSWFAYALGGLLLAEAGTCFLGSWYFFTCKPRLVLGETRLQYLVGKHLRWEAGYGEIGEIALFTPIHPLGYRISWESALGLRLQVPQRFDEGHPRLARRRGRLRRRCGFDLVLPMAFAFEPPERCLEAVLRCFHRFQAERESRGAAGAAQQA
jgi:hypothetical protein